MTEKFALRAPVLADRVEGGDGEGEQHERADDAERDRFGGELGEARAKRPPARKRRMKDDEALVGVAGAVAGVVQAGIDPAVDLEQALAPPARSLPSLPNGSRIQATL